MSCGAIDSFFVALHVALARVSPAAAYVLAWLCALLAALAARTVGVTTVGR
ncbi:hypothetical protein [Sorangium sp. So ce1000]|uniref:hypothetical protein n=1 Tax=Sorangium sp. So ce1000 TaxID=3133325 RepID=UPI003F6342B5